MFADFLKRLTSPSPQTLDDPDARLAVSALLVRVARSDGHFSPAERSKILDVLARRYSLNDADAEALAKDAEQLESEAPDTVRFTRAIKDAVPFETRITVIEGLWEVVLADGGRDAAEDSLVRLVSGLLGVTDQDSARARQRVSASI